MFNMMTLIPYRMSTRNNQIASLTWGPVIVLYVQGNQRDCLRPLKHRLRLALPCRSYIYLKWNPIPKSIRLLTVDPILRRVRQFEIEVEDDTGENHAHFSISEAISGG
jgi:hypothetical protein